MPATTRPKIRRFVAIVRAEVTRRDEGRCAMRSDPQMLAQQPTSIGLGVHELVQERPDRLGRLAGGDHVSDIPSSSWRPS